MRRELRQEMNTAAHRRSKKRPLSEQIHIDFRKWRERRIVLTRDGTRLETQPCRSCGRVGLLVPVPYRLPGLSTKVVWFVHVATVDELGERLLPHTYCAPARVKSRPPVIFVPRVRIEQVGT